jgi:hypothetical protein
MARDEDNTKILDLLKQKEFVLKIQKEAYVRWVDLITLIRFSMIGGAGLLAGAALLIMIMRPLEYLSTQNAIIAICCSFLAVILAALHIVLEMDKLHLESRRVLHEYEMLEKRCGTAQALSYPVMTKVYDEVQQKQALVRSEAKTTPPRWIKRQIQLIEEKFYQ